MLESNAVISRISRFDPRTGRLTRVAGGAIGFAGDGGPARDARFNEAQGIVLDTADRYLYVADTNNRRVRRIDLQQDVITTIAGTGALGATGNGGPAGEATLQGLTGIALALDGDLLLPDNAARSVRRIDLATRIAGTGIRDFTGEAGGAPDTALAAPYDAAVTPDGSVLIADAGNNRIRRIELAAQIDDDAEPAPTPSPTPQAQPAPVTPAVVQQPSAPEPTRNVTISKPSVTTRDRTVRRLRAGMTVATTVRGAAQVRIELRVGALTARRLGLRGTRRLAAATRTVTSDGSVKLRVRPGAAVRGRLAKARRDVQVTIRVVAAGPGATDAVASRTLTLRV